MPELSWSWAIVILAGYALIAFGIWCLKEERAQDRRAQKE